MNALSPHVVRGYKNKFPLYDLEIKSERPGTNTEETVKEYGGSGVSVTSLVRIVRSKSASSALTILARTISGTLYEYQDCCTDAVIV